VGRLPARQNGDKAIHDQQKHNNEVRKKEEGWPVRHRMMPEPPNAFFASEATFQTFGANKKQSR
jgi:hypothetical protein